MGDEILKIEIGNIEVEFSDLDVDDEMEISIENDYLDVTVGLYLNMDNIISLRDHLNYLITKFNSKIEES